MKPHIHRIMDYTSTYNRVLLCRIGDVWPCMICDRWGRRTVPWHTAHAYHMMTSVNDCNPAFELAEALYHPTWQCCDVAYKLVQSLMWSRRNGVQWRGSETWIMSNGRCTSSALFGQIVTDILENHISIKTLVPTCSVTQLHIPEDLNLQQENLKI